MLKKISIGEVMQKPVVTISPEEPLSTLADILKAKKIDAVPVLENRYLVGIIANLDLVRIPEVKWQQMTVRDVMIKKLVVGYSYESLFDALTRMNDNNISHLPIIQKNHPGVLVGFITLNDITNSYALPSDI
ncbi:MAG: CBS domain-containing protein [Dehalococcoidales bacterium]|nr:CBS domain-containing protein [Dehalococcoidales bacterium]